jgi:3-deoxy-D-manno-octulosonate 8-phosphate phosphatase KdsC-like HAD superfamily phosphatase
VKTRVDHVSTINGGSGVLREIVEIVLKAQNKYDGFLAQYLV